MSVLALIVALASACVSACSVHYTRRSTRVQEENFRIGRTPALVAETLRNTSEEQDFWVYTLRNDGPEDLDTVTMYPPEPRGGINYALAVEGGSDGWAEGPIQLGSLAFGQDTKFKIAVGAASPDDSRPVVRTRVEATAGNLRWVLVLVLDDPPNPKEQNKVVVFR